MNSWLPGRLSIGTHITMSCVSTGLVNFTSVVPPSANVNSATCSPAVGSPAVLTRTYPLPPEERIFTTMRETSSFFSRCR